MSVWFNFVAFQIGWFACVLGGAHGLPWVGTTIALGLVAVHLYKSPRPRHEAALIVIAAIVGLAVDTAMIRAGWLEFSSGMVFPDTAPHWIVGLWMIFATTLNVSLRWMKKHWALAAGLGAIGGPLAYLAGAKLGAVTLTETSTALVAVGAVWALAMPMLLLVADRFDGMISPSKLSEASCV